MLLAALVWASDLPAATGQAAQRLEEPVPHEAARAWQGFTTRAAIRRLALPAPGRPGHRRGAGADPRDAADAGAPRPGRKGTVSRHPKALHMSGATAVAYNCTSTSGFLAYGARTGQLRDRPSGRRNGKTVTLIREDDTWKVAKAETERGRCTR